MRIWSVTHIYISSDALEDEKVLMSPLSILCEHLEIHGVTEQVQCSENRCKPIETLEHIPREQGSGFEFGEICCALCSEHTLKA
jgi:hypothetical protein